MGRLVIVSNRIPVTVRRTGNGLNFAASSGGLVTALQAYLETQKRADPSFECIWLGWPGAAVRDDEKQSVKERLLREHDAYPVFLSGEDTRDFYYGFCNATLWPLFHYIPSYTSYNPAHFETYQRVNRLFRDALIEVVRPGDTIWIHDYQLMLLPGLAREALPNAAIGFFLHIPFPSYELFRLLPKPWRAALISGMLGADLIGFHTHDYTQYFLDCVFRTVGHDHDLGQIATGGQPRRADTFPISIDFERFMTAAKSAEVSSRRAEIESTIRERRAIFSVDRLDYTKGLLNRLHGYEEFLERYPEWQDRVVFFLSVIPSRDQVSHYRDMKHELDKRVGSINGRFGTMDWVPIVYQYRPLDFETLVALYSLSPVALITPLRDGMNLVAKEYLASKPDGTGVLILSEMAGAARELGESLLINPNHTTEIADALHQALTMPAEEQIRRNRAMQDRLKAYDSARWANHFLRTLARVKTQQGALATKSISPSIEHDVQGAYTRARTPLLLLDYDGTLVPFASRPDLAVPDPELLTLLRALATTRGAQVCIISGRDRRTLGTWFGQVGVSLIAEHGAWTLHSGGDWKTTGPLARRWQDRIAPILKTYVAQVAGSLLEEKEFSLAWHYRACDPELGAQRAKELIAEITQFTANLDLQVLEGKKVVEIRNSGVNKGAAALRLVAEIEPDFILAAGDDQTDEDLFRALPESAVTIRVGAPFSHARYHVADYLELRQLLARLTRLRSDVA